MHQRYHHHHLLTRFCSCNRHFSTRSELTHSRPIHFKINHSNLRHRTPPSIVPINHLRQCKTRRRLPSAHPLPYRGNNLPLTSLFSEFDGSFSVYCPPRRNLFSSPTNRSKRWRHRSDLQVSSVFHFFYLTMENNRRFLCKFLSKRMI